MLLYSMNEEEIRREINKDIQWVRERLYGLARKYHKDFKNAKKMEDLKLLGISHYITKNNNDVNLFLFLDKYGPLEIAAFKIKNGNKVKIAFLNVVQRQITILTDHFIERWLERNHYKSSINELICILVNNGFLRNCCDDTSCYCEVDDGIAFIEWNNNTDFYIFKTFVSKDMLYKGQEEFVKFSKEEKRNRLLEYIKVRI